MSVISVRSMYEAFISAASACVVEEGKLSVDFTRLARKHFSRGSALHDELELQRSLADSRMGSKSAAKRLLEIARYRARASGGRKLDAAMKALCSEGHELVVEQSGVDQVVQALLDEWRKGPKANPAELAKLEESALGWLSQQPEPETNVTEAPVDPLAMRLMARKFENRYGDKLTESQREIVSLYAFPPSKGKETVLSKKISTIASSALEEMRKHVTKNDSDTYTCQRITEAAKAIEADHELTRGVVTERSVSRAMQLCDMLGELKG